jgi:hypothetical protein
MSGDILDAFGAAQGTTLGGDDLIDASGNAGFLEAYGDVQGLGSHTVRAGNDTLIGSATVANQLSGDAGEVSGGRLFAGADTQTAVLRFTPESARWVADEVWHSRQVGRIEPDGSYVLELPFSREQELVMDLLRHGSGVEVLAPPALRERVASELAAAAQQYE